MEYTGFVWFSYVEVGVVCDFQLNKMLEEKLQPYIQEINDGVLPQPIVTGPAKKDQKVHLFSLATTILVVFRLVFLIYFCI